MGFSELAAVAQDIRSVEARWEQKVVALKIGQAPTILALNSISASQRFKVRLSIIREHVHLVSQATVQEFVDEVACVLNLPINVDKDKVMHSELVSHLELRGNLSQHVDRKLHHTHAFQVHHNVISLHFAGDHGMEDRVTADEVKKLQLSFSAHANVDRAFQIVVNYWSILQVSLKPVDDARIYRILKLVILAKQWHLKV